MSKEVDDKDQKNEDQPQYIIHHVKYNLLTCVCGELLESGHRCERWVRIQVVECKRNECDICTKMKMEHMFKD